MKIKRILTLVMVLCSLFAFLPSPGIAADNDKDPSIYFRPSVRFGTDDRTLYIMDFFVPLHRGNKDILFFNPRFTPNDTDGWETNLGIGYRHLLFSDKVALGANVFYDTRKTSTGTYWDQVGFGFEAMTEFNKYVALTGRFNYYIPLTDPIVSGSEGSGSGYYFRDLGIYTSGGGLIEEAPEGFDAELGFRVPYVSNYVETWVYGGGYHYHGDYVGDVDGWSARLEVIPTDFLRLNYEYREDRTNQGEHHGEVAFEVPFSVENLFAGKNPFAEFGKHIGGSRDIKERMVESVHRDIDIRVITEGSGDGSGSSGTEVAGVVFVSENAPNITGTPDGSFAHPFATVAAAVAAIESGGSYAGITTIHVMNDSDSLTVSGGLVDLASLLIWGSGLPHPTYGYIQNQYLGNPDIYDLNITADNVEVFGANFVGTTGITTSGTGTNVHDNYFTATTGINTTGGSSTITGNTFTGGTYGIVGDGGTVAVTDNELFDPYGIWINCGNYTITNNIIGSAANPITNTGIYAGGTDTSLDGVSGNTIVVSGSSGIAYGIHTSNLATSLVLTNNDITVTNTVGTAYGIYEYTKFDNIYGSITGGTITVSGNDAFGIRLDARNGSIGSSGSPFTITGVTVDATAETGYAFGIYETGPGGIYGEITGGSITAEGPGAIGLELNSSLGSVGDSTNPFTISDTTIEATATDGGAYGVVIVGADIDTDITGATVTVAGTGMGNEGIYEAGDDSFSGSITDSSVTVSGVDAVGISLNGSISSIGTSGDPFTISGVTISATGNTGSAYGIYEYGYYGSYLSISDNDITATTDTGGPAYGIYAFDFGGIYGSITGGTITASGASSAGIYLNEDEGFYGGPIGSSTDPFTISDITINSTGTTGNTYGISMYSTNDINSSISGNDITVTTTGGTAFGIFGSANGGISGEVTGGSITAQGPVAVGINLYGDVGTIGDKSRPFTISNTTIEATATDGGAYGVVMTSAYIVAAITGVTVTAQGTGDTTTGIYEYAFNSIYGSISGGSVTAGGTNAIGVNLIAAMDYIGASDNLYTISGVTISATGTTGSAYGVCEYGYNGIYSSLSGNDITATTADGPAYGVYEETDGGDINGAISGGTITTNGSATEGVYLWADNGGSIGSSTSPYTISGVTVNSTATGESELAYGVYLKSSGDIYADITNSFVTVTSEGGAAAGVGGYADGSIYGSITDTTVTSTGYLATTGIGWSASGSTIGSSTSPFTISGVTINATTTRVSASGELDTVGLSFVSSAGDLYAEITDSAITATSASLGAFGVYEYARDNVYGGIDGGTITASGLGLAAIGVSVEAYFGSIGSSASPYTISGATITATGEGLTRGIDALADNGDIYAELSGDTIIATSTSGTACGVYERTNINDIYGSITGGTITTSGNEANGVYMEIGNSIGSSTSPFTISGVTAGVTGVTARYFMHLTGSGSGTSAITWTGNSYTPYGGSAVWSGNYDTTGFTTNGPLYLNGITDAEVTP